MPDIVYAIEEPETSQHPGHQRALTDALIDLSEAPNTQVVLTTHSPEIVKRLKFENIILVSDQTPERVSPVVEHELPYPSLNEVNFSAFGEASYEYHNELYGFIKAEGRLADYKVGKPQRQYIRLRQGGSPVTQQVILTEYIRHQIHHPENDQNILFTADELTESIAAMRLCGYAAMRLCGYAAMRLCGYAAMRLCGYFSKFDAQGEAASNSTNIELTVAERLRNID